MGNLTDSTVLNTEEAGDIHWMLVTWPSEYQKKIVQTSNGQATKNAVRLFLRYSDES